MEIILASSSPQRKNLMASMGLEFKVVPADIDEKAIRHSSPTEMGRQIAKAKGEVVRAKYPNDIIIAADSFVICDEKVLEKPVDNEEAKEMLKLMSGQWLTEYNGFYAVSPTQEVLECVQTRARMRPLNEQEIAYYVEHYPVTTWAGAFSAAYDAGMGLFEYVDGSLTSFSHGLPMELVMKFLKSNHVA